MITLKKKKIIKEMLVQLRQQLSCWAIAYLLQMWEILEWLHVVLVQGLSLGVMVKGSGSQRKSVGWSPESDQFVHKKPKINVQEGRCGRLGDRGSRRLDTKAACIGEGADPCGLLVMPLSIDHKPDRFDERRRIEDAGGFIIWAGTWRVGGVLAVSRAFGDRLLKQYVVAEPEIQEREIDDVDFLILASDGIWNVIPNEDAVAMVQGISDAATAARKLTEEAYARGSADNITCLIVQFNHP
ncbi:probable protein phosphatase 2C 11 isoform X2 [Amborella trichopoda]|uniref:probable protein phosphatase 2C 11 isoform X2 n=1 Tax=Amborella trichopoda TaxID=13333 RepID=UPI0009C11106|nr:probable protein phosphatase 2C 11 isoform X2 [Amborella trichopoda]|eukprot:XP_020524461.1 probable protein phosphatase 2C 11 isoform X2 [Amborella trichopoda]